MKKLAIAFIVAIATFVLYYFLNKSNEAQFEFADSNQTLLPTLKCDLNKEPCIVNFKGESIKFDFKDKEIYTMKPLELVISNLEALNFKNPSLRAYGINMQMGNIDVKLKKHYRQYIAKMVLSACIVDIMRYRFEILDEGKPTGLFIDFDLRI